MLATGLAAAALVARMTRARLETLNQFPTGVGRDSGVTARLLRMSRRNTGN